MGSNEVSASLKATLVGGAPTLGATRSVPTVSSTLTGVGALAAAETAIAFDGPDTSVGAGFDGTGAGRTTVLPRRKGVSPSSPPVTDLRPRFDKVRVLGQGAMGEVELARDNDIRRTVAVKRLLSDLKSEAALLRFADEVRIVGQLEHPGIVPIYDVGRDPDGQVYLVMKHLHGETMESIIEKLRANDSAYAGRFTVEHRVHLFFGVLDAIRYAHARGILHRDLKPANVMIGPFGEVTIMDWGIAKPIRSGQGETATQPLDRTMVESHDERLLETRLGSLAGTPLYMSPEQAAGRNDELDARSDVYSLAILLYEWLTLEHPLEGKETVTEVLAAILTHDFTARDLIPRAATAQVPMEYIWAIAGGLERSRDRRYPSVDAFEEALRRAADGKMKVQCHVTFTKRIGSECLHWIDRHQVLFALIFFATLLAALVGIGAGIWRAFHIWF